MTTAITTSTPKHHLLRLAKGYHRLQSKVSGMKEAGEKVASLAIGAAETGLTAFALGATHAKFGGASGEAMVPVIGVPADLALAVVGYGATFVTGKQAEHVLTVAHAALATYAARKGAEFVGTAAGAKLLGGKSVAVKSVPTGVAVAAAR